MAKLSIMRNILIEGLAKRVYSEIVSRRGECTLRDNYRLDELAHSQSARVEHVAKYSVMRKLLQTSIAEHRARNYDSKCKTRHIDNYGNQRLGLKRRRTSNCLVLLFPL